MGLVQPLWDMRDKRYDKVVSECLLADPSVHRLLYIMEDNPKRAGAGVAFVVCAPE